MASKRMTFSTFTVESLLAPHRNVEKKIRQENEETAKSPEKMSNLVQEFDPGKQQLNLNDYISEDGSLKFNQNSLTKWRRNRTIFNSAQLRTLEETFRRQKYLSIGVRGELARALRLSEDQVKTWFQNRRTKFRKNLCVPARSNVIPNVHKVPSQSYLQYPYYREADLPHIHNS